MLFSNLAYTSIQALATDKILLLPLGAIEQHGPQLAVATDTDIVSNVASQVEKNLPSDVLLCPTLPFGSSDHHLDFGGTISIGPELYSKVIVDIVLSMLSGGFRKIVLLNGHGGNITPVKQALAVLSKTVDEKYKPNIALATYWEVGGKAFAGAPPMESPALSHACEYETSLMLHLFPEKVWMDKAERAPRPASNGYIPWEDDEAYKGVTLFKPTRFISGNGSSGEPQLATPDKGKHLFETAVRTVTEFLISFKEWPLMESLKK
ncbi:Putative mycofactocin system creatinine amidohydrolase family protein MftE [Dyadobacter sp. CECT 9275]|uniref:Mycofactocin system creatinine amidohydrolase family protein MftE n=1 Tax=Dyadobacter helix TaxID=2822344 RepID=A0A916J8H7_9BACT|nr:creatininase family protein [Dyadobacter sp. CECT 9275]CAG4989903.1 Putative mycofactocin system creatinine amidohydrolase family protein MftE [Dyadobacter sp. CECT 9275]